MLLQSGSQHLNQHLKICLQCRRPLFDSWVRKIHWRRDRLPTLVLLGFPGGSADKEAICNAGDLDSNPGLGRSPEEGETPPTPVFWPGEFHGLHSLQGHKESDTTEQLSLSLFTVTPDPRFELLRLLSRFETGLTPKSYRHWGL